MPSVFSSDSPNVMANNNGNNLALDVPVESRMGKVKKFMSSPLSRKKLSPGAKLFGAPLEAVPRVTDLSIPSIVKKVVDFITMHGIGHEGIFRVNGNTKVVEKMKTSFDKTGDANLEEFGDVFSVASLLKMYLRELPDAVIPESLHSQFVAVQEDFLNDPVECRRQFRLLIDKLPPEHFCLLKYLIQFLVRVSCQQDTNKMGSMQLAIVFGPNLFKCPDGVAGLREQGITNQIVKRFIDDYDELLLEEGETSPYSSKCIQGAIEDQPKVYNSAKYEDSNHNVQINIVDAAGTSKDYLRASTSSIEDDRSDSPFVYDSDATTYSPIVGSFVQEVVEQTIHETVTKHMFGNSSSSEGSAQVELDTTLQGLDVSLNDPLDSPKDAPVPTPRRRRRQKKLEEDRRHDTESSEECSPEDSNNRGAVDKIDSLQAAEEEDISATLSFREKVKIFDVDQSSAPVGDDRPATRPRRQRPNSQAFELFETQEPHKEETMEEPVAMAITIPHAEDDTTTPSSPKERPVPRPRSTSSPRLRVDDAPTPSPRRSLDVKKHVESDDFEDDEDVFPTLDSCEPLSSLTVNRASAPKRRKPSRKSKGEDHEEDTFVQRISEEDIEEVKMEEPPKRAQPAKMEDTSPEDIENIVPPLDLASLHEHGDGDEPIPAGMWHHSLKEEEEATLSPRSTKLKKRQHSTGHSSSPIPIHHHGLMEADFEAPLSPSVLRPLPFLQSAPADVDIPPSPPASHMHSMTTEDKEIRDLTKKIHSLKKKVRRFESQFEEEKGYRPSHADKMGRTDIRKIVNDLSKAKKDLKDIKDRAREERHSLSKTLPTKLDYPFGGGGGDPDSPLSALRGSLNHALHILAEKREDADRPEELERLTMDELREEKVAMQKELLHLESTHGRPTSKVEKDIVRPLYERYRQIKKFLSKPPSLGDLRNLETIEEGEMMEFQQTPPKDDGFGTTMTTNDFTVTQNFGLLQETREEDGEEEADQNGEGANENEFTSETLHQASLQELLDHLKKLRLEKKRLRAVLKRFEDDFFTQNGRKIAKEDRGDMSSEYKAYKTVKQSLKLVEALINKKDGSKTM
ncbi:protein FAM13A-like isoform X6 [Branchiostoma floridae]|uniref:Protein FAM13A-like isoform X6 n=1 Tax=Branchiostoma floridae TaxID=7739 RepID=A0A9J7KWH7_BRAFL|nr:protein FAM13A-like isoform X6 [Branchiostoma floridae]